MFVFLRYAPHTTHWPMKRLRRQHKVRAGRYERYLEERGGTAWNSRA